MSSNKKRVIFVALISVFFAYVCSAKAPSKTTKQNRAKALELLDKYAQTQDKLKSFIVKYETIVKGGGTRHGVYKKAEKHTTIELRTDGKRFKRIRRQWGNIPSIPWIKFVPETKATYSFYLWDGEYGYQYSRSMKEGRPHRLTLSTAKTVRADRGKSTYDVNGFILEDPMYDHVGDQHIDLFLSKEHKISMLDETERIGESDCFVIKAMTEIGNYKIWIDPQPTPLKFLYCSFWSHT